MNQIKIRDCYSTLKTSIIALQFLITCGEFCLKLLNEYNVLVVPGTAFGDSGEGSIRISYAASMERLEYFIDVLKRLENDKGR